MRQLTYCCFATRGEWYHCFKRPFGGGAGAGASQACSLVIGPYNRAASALPLTSQLGGPPPPPRPSPHHPPCLSSVEAPQLLSRAFAPRIAQTHRALPRHGLTAALSSACQAYANKEPSIHRALECQLSLCFLPFPLLYISSLFLASLYFSFHLSYSSSLTYYLLSICVSLAAVAALLFFPSDFASPFPWVSYCISPLLGICRTLRHPLPSFPSFPSIDLSQPVPCVRIHFLRVCARVCNGG